MKTMLEHLRETASLTQRDLARRAGITQETLSQLESGKARPRLDTLTKLRNALELGDMQPEGLLEPSPLDADTELDDAGAQLVRLLKVLPHYDYEKRRAGVFWESLCQHLDFPDHYPAAKIASYLHLASTASARRSVVIDLAEYTLTFFDPDDEALLTLLADHGQVGPGVPVARRWCRDVTDAAWILHRTNMTSYPQQVGELFMEAGESDNPQRIAELCHSVYAEVRARAFVRSPVDEQLRALREDPSDNVVSAVASAAEVTVQQAAVTLPRAWPGLARNVHITEDIAPQLVDSVLAELFGSQQAYARSALLDLSDRADLPRVLLERIKDTIDRREIVDDDSSGSIISSVLNVRGTLAAIDREAVNTDRAARERRQKMHVVETRNDKPSWWRRFMH